MEKFERRLLLITGTFGFLACAVALAVLLLAPNTVPALPNDDTVADSATTERGEPALYVTTMTHMEGGFKDDVDEGLFLRHVDQMRTAMELFAEYGAKLTFESEQSFAKANTNWGLNILAEVVERGHGVGTHADFGAEGRTKDAGFYRRALLAGKKLVDDLVGEENNRGLSGGTGYDDWVVETANAGFAYMDALTGYAYLPMPLEARPDGWTDDYIRSTVFHDSVPVDPDERVRFFELANADDLVPDADGVITIAGGEIGELSSLAEGRSTCFPDCELTADDVDAFVEAIIAADEVREETGEPVKVNVHIPLTLLIDANDDVLRYFLSEITALQEENEAITWATQGQAYDGWIAWNRQ